MKLRIQLQQNTFVEMDVPEGFDLNMCGQSTMGTGFFCNGAVFIPRENIVLMAVWSGVGEPPISSVQGMTKQ